MTSSCKIYDYLHWFMVTLPSGIEWKTAYYFLFNCLLLRLFLCGSVSTSMDSAIQCWYYLFKSIFTAFFFCLLKSTKATVFETIGHRPANNYLYAFHHLSLRFERLKFGQIKIFKELCYWMGCSLYPSPWQARQNPKKYYFK